MPAGALAVRLQAPASQRAGQPAWTLSSSTNSKFAMSYSGPLTGVLRRGFPYSRLRKFGLENEIKVNIEAVFVWC